MNLTREGRPVSEQEYIDSTASKKHSQQIIDRLGANTINLKSMLPSDSVLKPQKSYGAGVPLMPEMKKNEKNSLYQPNNQKKSTVYLKQEMNSVDQQVLMKKMEKELQHQRDLNNELKMDINSRQERFVKREMEYRKIIEELQKELRSKANLDFNDKKVMEEVQNVHGQIIDKIQVI